MKGVQPMHRYYIHFKSQMHPLAPWDERTKFITAEKPIEYDSDIADVRNALAESLGVEQVVLLNWHPLKGEVRP